jgi:hypothetical protein
MSTQLQMTDHRPRTGAWAAAGRLPARRFAYAALTAALLALLIYEVAEHGHLPAALLGAVGPDLALLLGAGAGLAQGQLNPRAVPIYNAVHRFGLPALLIALASLDVIGLAWFIAGLAWALHVSLDRSVGYGLRDANGFQRAR